MNKVIIGLMVAIILLLLNIVYIQAKNNKQLIYDLNVSQTAFTILKSQIVEGSCLPRIPEFDKELANG